MYFDKFKKKHTSCIVFGVYQIASAIPIDVCSGIIVRIRKFQGKEVVLSDQFFINFRVNNFWEVSYI